MNTGNTNLIYLQRYTWDTLPPDSTGTSIFPGSGTPKLSQAELRRLLDEIASVLADPSLIDISGKLRELVAFRHLIAELASPPPDPYLINISRNLQELVEFQQLIDELASLPPGRYLINISRRLQGFAGLQRFLDELASLPPNHYLIDISGKLQELGALHQLLDEIASPPPDPYLINMRSNLQKLVKFSPLIAELASPPPDPYLINISRNLEELAELRHFLNEVASLSPDRYRIDLSDKSQELAAFHHLLGEIASPPSNRYLIDLSGKSQELVAFRRLLNAIAFFLPDRYQIERRRKLQKLAELHSFLDETIFPPSDSYPTESSRKLNELIISLPPDPYLISRSGKRNDLLDYNRKLKEEIAAQKKLLGQSKNFVKQNTPFNKFFSRFAAYIAIFIVLCLLLVSIVKPGIESLISNSCSSGSIIVNASVSMNPLLEQAKADYQKRCSSATININPSQPSYNNDLSSGSPESLTHVENNQANIGNIDTFADPSQQTLKDNQTTVVIYAFVINSQDISLTSLTTQKIEGIYVNGVNNWSDIDNVSRPTPLLITRVSYPATAEISNIFVKHALQGETDNAFLDPPGLISDTPAIALENVCQTAGAITYVPLYYAKSFLASPHGSNDCSLRILSIDNKKPDNSNVTNNSYKFWSLEHLYTKGNATGLTKAFIDHISILSDPKNGYLSVADVPYTILDCHEKGAC